MAARPWRRRRLRHGALASAFTMRMPSLTAKTLIIGRLQRAQSHLDALDANRANFDCRALERRGRSARVRKSPSAGN